MAIDLRNRSWKCDQCVVLKQMPAAFTEGHGFEHGGDSRISTPDTRLVDSRLRPHDSGLTGSSWPPPSPQTMSVWRTQGGQAAYSRRCCRKNAAIRCRSGACPQARRRGGVVAWQGGEEVAWWRSGVVVWRHGANGYYQKIVVKIFKSSRQNPIVLPCHVVSCRIV